MKEKERNMYSEISQAQLDEKRSPKCHLLIIQNKSSNLKNGKGKKQPS